MGRGWKKGRAWGVAYRDWAGDEGRGLKWGVVLWGEAGVRVGCERCG